MIKLSFIAQLLLQTKIIFNYSSIIFFINAFFYCAIAFIFYKTIDGTLRKAMMYTFLFVGIGTFLRGLYFYLPVDFRLEHLDLLNTIIILPALLSGIICFFYLYYTFYRKEKEKNLDKYLKVKNKEKKDE